MLRKWHTYIWLLIALSITGIYLLDSKTPQNALISATMCDDHSWVGFSSEGVIGNALSDITLPFSVTAVSAVSCTDTTIDVALAYGPIVTIQRSPIRWSMIERPFSGKIRTIQRLGNELVVTTQTLLWKRSSDWALIQSFSPTLAQTIYEFHAGWFSGQSFQWVWSLTGFFWLALTLSGIWVFIRMTRL